jgi:hypothetical protein
MGEPQDLYIFSILAKPVLDVGAGEPNADTPTPCEVGFNV